MKASSSPRWELTLDGFKSKLIQYGDTKQDVLNSFKGHEKVLEIKPYTDTSYLDYIQKIVDNSELISEKTKGDMKNEFRQIKRGRNTCLIKFYKDLDDGYYDFLEYQRQFNQFINPVTYTWDDPKSFYEEYRTDLFGENAGKEHKWISYKELRKEKPKLLKYKGVYKFWVDADGYYYVADKRNYPSKRNRELFKEFGNNPNAVCVECKLGSSKTTYDWWHNFDEFLEYFKEESKKVPAYEATPSYRVLHKGFQKTPPEDRKVILRLPFFNVQREIKNGQQGITIARAWLNLCNPKFIDPTFDELLDDLIKADKNK